MIKDLASPEVLQVEIRPVHYSLMHGRRSTPAHSVRRDDIKNGHYRLSLAKVSFHPRTNSAHNPSHNSKLMLVISFKYKNALRTPPRSYLPALSSRCSCRPGGVSNCCPSTTVAAKDRNGPRGRLREIIYGRVRLRARGSRPFKQNNHTSRRRCSSHGKVSKAPSLSAAWNTRTGVSLETITECGWLNDLERPL